MADRITWMNVVLCIAIQYSDEYRACQGILPCNFEHPLQDVILFTSGNNSGIFALAPPPAAGWGRKAGTPRTPPRGLAGPLEPPAE